jgi:hypothetical protein
LVFELTEVFAKGSIELLNIFVLLAVLNALWELWQAFHGLLDTLIEAVGPIKGTRNRWQVVGDRCTLINSVNEAAAFQEDLLHSFQVLLVKLEKGNVLLLKFILNDGSVEEALEGIEKLELTDDGVWIIEALGQDWSKTALELLDSVAELVEIVIELALLNVIAYLHELVNGLVELVEDLHHWGSELLALSVTDFDLLELVELNDSWSEVHDVLASLLEWVKADEEGIGGDLPLVGSLGLTLVLKVSILELWAGLKSESELVVGLLWLLVLDTGKDWLAINVFAALADDGVADLADQDYKASRGVVVRRVGPDHEDHVHDGNEEIRHFSELLAQIS